MPVLTDARKEAFAQLRARGVKASPAYRECFETNALPTTIWTAAWRTNGEVSDRILEIQEEHQIAASLDKTILSKQQYLRDLSEAWASPLDAIDASSQFAQEHTVTVSESGTQEKIKAVSKMAVGAELSAILGWKAPAIGSLHLHSHAAPQASLTEVAGSLADKYRLGAVHEAEIVENTPV